MRVIRALEAAIAHCLGRAVLLAVAVLMCANPAATAAPLQIVAIGASNTHGWYVGNQGAYPAQLQALLRAKGIDAQVTNAGVPFETTGMMLRRIDRDVPDGTDIVILEPGGNDRRFFVPPEWRAANIAEMERRLKARSISVIVYDEVMPLQYRALDLIHFDQFIPIVVEVILRISSSNGMDTPIKDVIAPSPRGTKPTRGSMRFEDLSLIAIHLQIASCTESSYPSSNNNYLFFRQIFFIH